LAKKDNTKVIITLEDLQRSYQEITTLLRCECRITTDIVAGQPADEKGVQAFVKHHLHLTGQEAENAVRRILREEIGESDVTPELGEIQERESYGVCCFRRDAQGRPWLGCWQAKANIKQAASRTGLFQQKKGVKGDMAEGGQVVAYGASLLDPQHPERIYPVNAQGGPATTTFKEFMGRVHSPKGDVSIVHHSECIPFDHFFFFEYRYIGAKLSQQNLKDMLAVSMQCGLGSVRSLEMGKFVYLKVEMEDGKRTSNKSKEEPEAREALAATA